MVIFFKFEDVIITNIIFFLKGGFCDFTKKRKQINKQKEYLVPSTFKQGERECEIFKSISILDCSCEELLCCQWNPLWHLHFTPIPFFFSLLLFSFPFPPLNFKRAFFSVIPWKFHLVSTIFHLFCIRVFSFAYSFCSSCYSMLI